MGNVFVLPDGLGSFVKMFVHQTSTVIIAKTRANVQEGYVTRKQGGVIALRVILVPLAQMNAHMEYLDQIVAYLASVSKMPHVTL